MPPSLIASFPLPHISRQRQNNMRRNAHFHAHTTLVAPTATQTEPTDRYECGVGVISN